MNLSICRPPEEFHLQLYPLWVPLPDLHLGDPPRLLVGCPHLRRFLTLLPEVQPPFSSWDPCPDCLIAVLTSLLATPGYNSSYVALSISSQLPLPAVPSHLGQIMLANGYDILPLVKAPQLPPRLPANHKYAFFFLRFILCMEVFLSACISLHQKKGIKFHETIVIDCCEPP